MLTLGAAVPTELTVDGDDLYWLELRPREAGRYALYRRREDGRTEEGLRTTFNVRSRVHEYGGGSYCTHAGVVYFSNFADQLVYRAEPGEKPMPITTEGLRYADCVFDERRKLLIGVREDHTDPSCKPTNTLATIGLDGSSKVLVSGKDFYASPTLDPSGSTLAWLSWNFPNMPWDGTELWTGRVGRDASIERTELIAGGEAESIFQPQWSPDGTLYFISDRTGWWNLYRTVDGEPEAVLPKNADFGRPHWVFRLSTYAFESEGRIVCAFSEDGTWHLASIDTERKKLKALRLPYTEINYVRARPGFAVFLAGSPSEPTSVVMMRLVDGSVKVVYKPKRPKLDPGFISVPRHAEFRTTDREKAFGFFYPPTNRKFRAVRGEKPPLIVMSHGGPTSQATTALNLGVQCWTSRGFAVLDVNYRGSTGYGRVYRNRLEGKWGVVDVDDCENGARHLARAGHADGRRLIIRGGSAGGYTTLCALTFRKTFQAGASYFGVSDAEALARETHKFESRYLDKMIGAYPERADRYRERSPIRFVGQLSCPVIFFQGLEDKVVPPNQAKTMVEALRKKGVPVAYVAFEGEQHGFRRAETIKRAFESELYFYSKVFGFKLADRVAPVQIDNLRSG